MAEEKKTTKKAAPKKSSKKTPEVNTKTLEVKFDKKPVKECILIEKISRDVRNRLKKLEDYIDNELNPLHRVELEAKRNECHAFLEYLEKLTTESPEAKLIKAIFCD